MKKMKPGQSFEKMDMKADLKKGIKEGSKLDMKMDAKAMKAMKKGK